MEAKMVRLTTAVLASVALVAMTSPAFADPVSVDLADSQAQGDMGTAHNLGDGEFIGCTVNAPAYADSPMVICQARASDGTFAICFSTSPILISAAESMTTVSEVAFAWDSQQTCTSLLIGNYSQPPGRNTSP
jgi:hypothetical protein